ncbi:MAG: NAD(+)/NADH kinase [Anaerolineales bacterium]|nr:NAD(+)/NADH kinase [Anaerolineales bacterium]
MRNAKFGARADGATPESSVPRTFRHIGILHHPRKPESLQLAQQIGQSLAAAGVPEIWHASAWEEQATIAHLPDVDLLITLGGDGTLLRAARMGAEHAVPMLGVKMGRLGFLAEVQPNDWEEPLKRILKGDYWIEHRLMVRAVVKRIDPNTGEFGTLCAYDALNDVVLSRGNLARVVRISAELDDGYLTTYTCDGLIVSTATGSTGYALAVSGPVMPPELRNILVIPIAPHLSMDRAVILSEGSTVRLRAFSDYPPMLTVDGQVVVELEEGDEVMVVGSPHLARFIRVREPSYFYQTLMEKMQWTI